MGGNSVSTTTRTTRVRTPKVDTEKAKLDKLLNALKGLDADEKRDAIDALKDAGLDDLAKALKGVVGGGSRPPTRRGSDSKPSRK